MPLGLHANVILLSVVRDGWTVCEGHMLVTLISWIIPLQYDL